MNRGFLILLALLTTIPFSALADDVKGPHSTVSLVSESTALTPDGQNWLGLRFDLEPGWHIYWKNPGDSGLPPKLTWTIPGGIQVADVSWPVPERIAVGPLMNYGYDGVVLLPFNVKVAADAAPLVKLTLAATWLECRDECLPGKGEFTIELPTTGGMPTKFAPEFSAARKALPTEVLEPHVRASYQDGTFTITALPLDGAPLPERVFFLADERLVIDNAAEQHLSRTEKELQLTVKLPKSRKVPPQVLSGLLVSETGWGPSGEPKALEFKTIVSGVPAPAPMAQAASSAPAAPQTSALSFAFIAILGGAFFGGLILNLMPCVFPVLGIKVLGFVELGKGDPRVARLHGYVFALGVVLSFLFLGGVLLIFRANGVDLGWGFQLQSPLFVASLALVFFFLGLSLFGIVEFGHSVQRMCGSVRSSSGYWNSFLSGALATLVATPCTAPFMGSAIAAAVTLSPVASLLIFATIGIGMAAPYVILTMSPALLRYLPRPGEWMVTCKQFMSFPLFATTLWLSWVFGRQVGLGTKELSVFLVLLETLLVVFAVAWILGRWGQPHCARRSRISAWVIALVILGAGFGNLARTLNNFTPPSASAACASGAASAEPDEFGLVWFPYSQARLDELLRGGQPVYLDFTAAWCITCQVNHQLVFGDAAVREKLKGRSVALLRGDWTSMDPEITRALTRYGRSGVPLNVFYGSKSAGENIEPKVLPSILTPGVVLEVLS